MHGPAELQISAQSDGQRGETVLQIPDRKQIRERLRRMLMAAVAGVDHRDPGELCRDGGGAFFRVTDRRDIREAGDGPDCIRDALALRGGRGARVGESHRAAAQVQHGGLDGKPCARAGLIEERGQLFSVAQMRIPLLVFAHVVSEIKETVQLADRKIKWCDQMPHIFPPY